MDKQQNLAFLVGLMLNYTLQQDHKDTVNVQIIIMLLLIQVIQDAHILVGLAGSNILSTFN